MKTSVATRKRLSREKRTDDEINKDRISNTQQQKRKRTSLTTDEQQQIRDANAQLQRTKRANQTAETLQLEAERRRRKRAGRTAEERNEANIVRRNSSVKTTAKVAITCTSTLKEDTVTLSSVGTMDSVCSGCNAKMFPGELHRGKVGTDAVFSLCCAYGTIKLPPIKAPPILLQRLFTTMDSPSREFRKNIRLYNSNLSLASVGVNLGQVFNFTSRGPWTYKINGQIYHAIGNVFPEDSARPSFAQLYVYDPHHEIDHRLSRNPEVNQRVLSELQQCMREHNPYVRQYVQVSQICIKR